MLSIRLTFLDPIPYWYSCPLQSLTSHPSIGKHSLPSYPQKPLSHLPILPLLPSDLCVSQAQPALIASAEVGCSLRSLVYLQHSLLVVQGVTSATLEGHKKSLTLYFIFRKSYICWKYWIFQRSAWRVLIKCLLQHFKCFFCLFCLRRAYITITV